MTIPLDIHTTVTSYRTAELSEHANNSDLSKRQQNTIKLLIDLHTKLFVAQLYKLVKTRVHVDILKPYVEYQIYGQDHDAISSLYSHATVNVPLDTPTKSMLTLNGRFKSIFTTENLDRTVPGYTIYFNATKIENWHRILANLRPHIMNTYKNRTYYYNQKAYDELPI